MAKVTGKCFISLAGTKLHTDNDAELDIGGEAKKVQMSVHGLVGHAVEEIKPGKITGSIIHTADIDLVALQAWEGAAVFETDSGLRYMVRDAVVEDTLTLGKGKVKITLVGRPAILI